MIYREKLLYKKEIDTYFVIKKAILSKNKIKLFVENQHSERSSITIDASHIYFDTKQDCWIIR